jgi:hypothetical protein
MKWFMLSLVLIGQSASAARLILFDRPFFATAIETAYRARVISMTLTTPRRSMSPLDRFRDGQMLTVTILVTLKRVRDDQVFTLHCRRAKQNYSEINGYRFILEDCDTRNSAGVLLTPEQSAAEEFPFAKTPLDLNDLIQLHPYGPS